ncbi:hypothetical protein CRUP_034622 [Coryphaenoides rupestris]|nr:hypothetical protein CRUP_034622 [Coryphaenoides rupestris]
MEVDCVCWSVSACPIPEQSCGLRGPTRDRESDQRHWPDTSRHPLMPTPYCPSASPCQTERAGGGPTAISVCRSPPSQCKPAFSADPRHHLPTAPSQHATGALSAPHRAPDIPMPRAENTQPCLSGPGVADGGRQGVSFCFSRREPRLEPSASVFSEPPGGRERA